MIEPGDQDDPGASNVVPNAVPEDVKAGAKEAFKWLVVIPTIAGLIGYALVLLFYLAFAGGIIAFWVWVFLSLRN